jgi:hypothetical protein
VGGLGSPLYRLFRDRDSAGVSGARVKSARSWASVSRIKVVISWGSRRALANILGGGNLKTDKHK